MLPAFIQKLKNKRLIIYDRLVYKNTEEIEGRDRGLSSGHIIF